MNRDVAPAWKEWLTKLKKTFPVIFAASIATLAHSYPNFILLSWADALDTYSYVIVANISSSLSSVSEANPEKVFVVGIDQKAYEEQYLERSPLDRAALSRHLQAIYDQHPKIVAIDIDISPALCGARVSKGKLDTDDSEYIPVCNSESADQQGSQPANPMVDYYLRSEETLYNTIINSGIDTVLISPLTEDLQNTAEQVRQTAWLERMRSNSHVHFGHPDLPIKHGVTLTYVPTHASKVCRTHIDDDRDSQNSCPTLGVAVYCRLADPSDCERAKSASKDNQRIDFKPYRAAFGYGEPILAISNLTDISNTGSEKSLADAVVFFGARYGSDDKLLTPVGELYGVNVHAAGFLTQSNPVSKLDVHFPKLLSWILDFLVGIPAALAIGYFWRRYFNASTQTQDPLDKQAAYKWIVLIVIVLTFYVIAIHLFSIFLLNVKLHNGSLWLSPLLITVSLLINAFLFGSIKTATKVLEDHRVATSQPVDSQSPPADPGTLDVEQAEHDDLTKRQSLRLGTRLLVLLRKATPICVVLFALWTVFFAKE